MLKWNQRRLKTRNKTKDANAKQLQTEQTGIQGEQ